MSNTDESFAEGMIKYSSRDYDSIVEDFWSVVPTLTELWKPDADSDPGVVLGKWLASVADMLGVNLDYVANEVFAPSVRQRKNAEKLFDLIGYKLGWYTAARTEVTFTNTGQETLTFDLGFNGGNFSTLNAYTDITGNSRVITYNILPLTNSYGNSQTRSMRTTVTDDVDVFADTDVVRLKPGESVTRVAIEGELRSFSKSVKEIKANNYIITLPSQHVDTTSVWIKAKVSSSSDEYLATQWKQVDSPSDFITPEPRFAVTYDSYSNAQIQISSYLNDLEDYDNYYLTVYWIDCSGVIGCVGEDVLSNLLLAKTLVEFDTDSDELAISNLSNTLELPHTYTVTGKSPETAKEAYYNSRNYINTFDSLVTLPDFNRFLNREPGVDCGVVIDCQKALDINMAIYQDDSLTASQKSKMYITSSDFPSGNVEVDWSAALGINFDPEDPTKYVFAANFQTYTAMCFAVHNDFKNSSWGQGEIGYAQIQTTPKFQRYKPPVQFVQDVIRDYKPLQAMTVELQFGYLRVFPWYVVGDIYPKKPVDESTASNLVAKVKEALALYFSPANRKIGVKPTVMEVVNVVRNADTRIDYFDVGNPKYSPINYKDCDIECFNAISFARYLDPGDNANNIRVNPQYIVK